MSPKCCPLSCPDYFPAGTAEIERGVGGKLLDHLVASPHKPMLVGTWAAAVRAIRFDEKHGFRLVPPDLKELLLRKYWSIPARQIETSVVLAGPDWQAS